MSDDERDATDERNELLKRFVEFAKRRKPDEFFEENELVDIFDYATDINDDFVKLEVIQHAAAFYPASIPLIERKAFMYLDLGLTDAAGDMARLLPDDSVMRKLIELRTGDFSQDEELRRLNEIVETTPEFEDEWLIRLSETVQELMLTEWLFENKEKLCSKTPYPQTLIYDLVNIDHESFNYPRAQVLAEELTTLEPFSAEFWEILAREYAANDEHDKALNAVEYALAINPDSPFGLRLKAEALQGLNRPTFEVVKPLDRILEQNPDDLMACLMKARILNENGRKLEALNTLESYRRHHPDTPQVVFQIVEICEGAVNPEILKPIITDNINQDGSISYAQCLAAEGKYAAAATLYLANSKETDTPINDVLMEALYRSERFDEAIKYFDDVLYWILSVSPSDALYYVASRIRTANIDEEFLRRLSIVIENLETLSPIYLKGHLETASFRTSAIERLHKAYDDLIAGHQPNVEQLLK